MLGMATGAGVDIEAEARLLRDEGFRDRGFEGRGFEGRGFEEGLTVEGMIKASR